MWILSWSLFPLNETLQVIYQSKYVSLSIILLYCSNCLVTAILLLENILEVVCFAQSHNFQSCAIVLHYWYTAQVRGLNPTSVSSPDSVSDSVIPSSFLAVLRSPRVIASSRGPGSLLMAASAPLEEQEQFTVNKQHTKQHPSTTASSTNSRQLSGHLSPARSKLSPVTCQNSGVSH